MAAVFGTPVAAALLAVELMLFEWKPRSLIPVAAACAVAGALRVPLLGAGPLFPVVPHPLLPGAALAGALGLGIAAGFASGLLTWLVYACEDLFRKLPIHWMWWPILGGAVVELTHDVNVLPSLFVACMAADVVTVLLMKRSILTEKVARRGYHVMREYIVSPLHQLRVADVMERDVPTVPASLPLAALFARLAELAPVLGRRQAWVLVDDRGRPTALLTRGDLIRALDELDDDRPTVLDAATRSLIVAYPDELLDEATARMLEANVGRLPVVSREDHGKLVGYLGRSGVMAAWLHVAREEHHREPGWLTEQLNQLRSSRTK